MNWYYIDGPRRVGPLNETEWTELVRTGVIVPETLVWHEGMEKWTPFSQVIPATEPPPEPPELEVEPAAATEEDPQIFAARVVDLDYPVNLSDCVSRAWNTYKAAFWMLVGSSFFISALTLAGSSLPVLRYAMPMALQGVLLGGLYYVYLRLMRGQPTVTSDLFTGFQAPFFKALALKTLIAFLVTQLCLIPVGLAAGMLGLLKYFEKVATAEPSEKLLVLSQALQTAMEADSQRVLVWLLVLMTCLLPVVYFAFCWMFAIPLIVDKKMAFWPAMQLSRAKVLQHPWRIAILTVVAGLLGYVGIFGIFIGILFTLPLYFLVLLYQYEAMFNAPASPQPTDKRETE